MPACIDRDCQIGDCDPGHDNCDGQEANGCETPLDSVQNCGACRRTCNSLNSNACLNGDCLCGNLPECDELTPVCDNGECVECLTNAHCSDHPGGPHCIDRECKECNPVTNAGCDADGVEQICGDDAECRVCASDAECILRGIDRNECVEVEGVRQCVTCDRQNNSGCSGLQSVCDAGSLSCRGCRNNNECAGGECLIPQGEEEGECEGCDPVADPY